jgi:hypothetical protein
MKNDLIKIKFSVEQKEALKKMQLQIKAAEASYGKEFESINDFLRVHGYIKPRDFDEFIWWLYLIKLKQEQLYPVPKITDTLFIEYHEYRKQNLLINTNYKNQGKSAMPSFTNNFDNIKPDEIFMHFKQGLVDKGYLTENELSEYLRAAFELKAIPETLFKLKHTPTKQKIYTIFYNYYKDIAQKKHNRQTEYAALLGDYFEGYKTAIIQTNWAKEYKAKR